MQYPKMAPATEAIEQSPAKASDLFLAPRARAISNMSGGIGKNEASEKASINRIAGPYELSAQLKTQSYNLRNTVMTSKNYGNNNRYSYSRIITDHKFPLTEKDQNSEKVSSTIWKCTESSFCPSSFITMTFQSPIHSGFTLS